MIPNEPCSLFVLKEKGKKSQKRFKKNNDLKLCPNIFLEIPNLSVLVKLIF